MGVPFSGRRRDGASSDFKEPEDVLTWLLGTASEQTMLPCGSLFSTIHAASRPKAHYSKAYSRAVQ
jgi:hypothetical protein